MTAILTTPLGLRYSEGRFNIAPGGKIVPTKFLTPGLVSYRDQAGGKVELLRKETIDEALGSIVGTPVTIGHIAIEDATSPDVSNGQVANPRFNADDGWYWCDSVVDTDLARQRIDSGEAPSCGYEVLAYGPGGVWQNMRYDREITAIRFNHMAIVSRPRYTDSVFRLNSLPPSDTNMKVFKLLKKLVTRTNGTDETKVSSTDVSGDSTVEIDGVQVRLNDLGKAWMDSTSGAVTAGGDDEVMIEGCENPVKLNELKECYRNSMAARKNETDAAEKKKKDDEAETARQNALTDEQRNNEAAAALKKKEDAESQARKNDLGKQSFDTLQGARFRVAAAPEYSTSSGSLSEKVEAGKKRY